jgi:CRISPR/Cas system-associated protein Cas5 (RAMP superfamily)|tara:strand:+ start:114 stop:380 length:267 start_codon:yes stop_codon:yes gene_type:complete
MAQQNINMRNYNITKYKNNTHYTVNVTDSFGQEHTDFFREKAKCYKFVYKVWSNEVKKPVDLLANAIAECIKLDKKAGITSKNYDCLD